MGNNVGTARTASGRDLAVRVAAFALAAAIGASAFAGSAYAATVHGADFHGSGSALESGEVDVLNVDGSAGETVFLTVKGGGETIAQNLPYTIGENASAGDAATYAGVATLDIDGLNLDALDGTYVIEAYSDRAGSEQLYSGALYGVYADLSNGTSKLIGTRTADASETTSRAFQPPETLYVDGKTYRLVGQASTSGAGSLHFTYEAYDESTTVDGVVKYIDATGNAIASTKIPGLEYGETRSVSIPSIITADNGDLYRTVFFADSVTVSNPGKTSYSIYCTKMSEADQALAGFYLATIQLVDGSGHVIATDSVNVTGEFLYTAPSVIYKTETVDAQTGETAVVTYRLNQEAAIRLSAADDGVVNRERTITVRYEAEPLDSAEVTVTFNLVDGSKRVNEEGRVFGTYQTVATDETSTVEPEREIDLGGVSYYLVGDPSDYAFTLHEGMVPSIDAYYVPEGYEAPGPYDVTVNYVNFLTGAVIESHSYTSDAGGNARITIDSPGEFSVDGVDYVKLAGQEAAIAHSFYSGIQSYTVYYRDKNDELSSGVVINAVRVVYEDGSAAGGDADASAQDASATAADDGTQTADDGAQALQLNPGRTYNVFDGDGNATLTNESGVDSNTERIEDNETPLASGFDRGASSSAAASWASSTQWLLPAGIALAVLAVALVAVVVIRRRNDDDDDAYEM